VIVRDDLSGSGTRLRAVYRPSARIGDRRRKIDRGPDSGASPPPRIEKERYLRAARVTVTPRIFGDIIHADGGGRDLRNHLLAQRTPETFWEIDCLYRGIEA